MGQTGAAISEVSSEMGIFFDVPADAYYAKAVAWIVENVAYTGMGGGKFSPDATCMRAQAMTFLRRAMFK